MVKYYLNVILSLLILSMTGCLDNSNESRNKESNSEESQYCDKPAPLSGQFEPSAPGYIVVFKDGVDVDTELNILINEYEVQVGAVYETAIIGFFGEMSVDTRERLRCDDRISFIEYNALVSAN